jgi:hypothetical protein
MRNGKENGKRQLTGAFSLHRSGQRCESDAQRSSGTIAARSRLNVVARVQ